MQQTNKVNIFLGASGTEDDSGSGSNNSGSQNRHYNRKLYHRRQRIPPKKLEVRTPSVQDLENNAGKKSKSKNHQNPHHHHRAVWYFYLFKILPFLGLKNEKNGFQYPTNCFMKD